MLKNSKIVINDVEYKDEDNLISWKFEFDADTFIGGFSAARLDVEFFTPEDKPNFDNQEVLLFYDDSLMGKFTVVEGGTLVDVLGGTVKITCLDYADKCNKLFNPEKVTYPCTYKQFMNHVYAQSGIEALNQTLLFENEVLTKQPNFDNTMTCRELISQYAQANLRMAKMNSNGQLEYVNFRATPQHEITYHDIIEVSLEEVSDPINAVVLSRQPMEDNIVAGNSNNPIELKICDNVFLDDLENRRETTIDRVFNAIKGFSITPFKMQVFERTDIPIGAPILIKTRDKPQGVKSIYCKVVYDYNGGILADVSCAKPIETKTDYKIAGTKLSIQNTQIMVDKVNQRITSIVDRQDEYGQQMTEVVQNIHNLSVTVQTGGGLNLIKNSVGYANLDFWELYPTRKDARTGVSTWILQGVSKHGFILNNAYVTQKISVLEGRTYTLSGKVKKATASGYIRIGVANVGNGFVGNEASTYDDEFKYTFTSPSNEIELILNCTSTGVEITDLSLIEGDNQSVWTQASGEIYNVNVLVDTQGIKVYNTQKTAYTIMSPSEFAHYYGNQKVFTINGDIAELEGLLIKNKGLFMPPIKFVQNKTRNSVAIVYMGG